MMTQVKPLEVLSIIATEVTDSMSFNCKNDMWTEITLADSEVITVRIPQV